MRKEMNRKRGQLGGFRLLSLQGHKRELPADDPDPGP